MRPIRLYWLYMSDFVRPIKELAASVKRQCKHETDD